MSDLSIILGQGGLLRDSESLDQATGLVFYTSAALDPLMNSNDTHRIYSLAEAEAKGILETGAFEVLHYFVKRYFSQNPSGDLAVKIAAEPSAQPQTFSKVVELQMDMGGELRQIGVFTSATLSATLVQTLQARAEELVAESMPASLFLGADIKTITDLTTLPNLRTLNCPRVSVVIAQSGSGKGLSLFTAKGYSIPALGDVLGAVSKSNVAMNIGEVGRIQLVNDNELAVAAYANGQVQTKLTSVAQKALVNKGLITLRKIVGDYANTYIYDAPTAVAVTSDYAYVENVRTIDKAVRLIRLALLPTLNSGVKINPVSGNLDETFVAGYKSIANRPLNQMENEGSISGFSVTIDPKQKVLQTGTLRLSVSIVPIGVARNIVVNLGYTTKIAN